MIAKQTIPLKNKQSNIFAGTGKSRNKCGGEKKQISGEKKTLKHIVFKCEKTQVTFVKKKMVQKMVGVKKVCECGASQK